MCDAIGAPELPRDPSTNPARLARRTARAPTPRSPRIRPASRPTIGWQVFNAIGIPCGPIYSIDQTFADPQVQHLNMAVPVTAPELGDITIVRNAVSMSRTPHESAPPHPAGRCTPTRYWPRPA